MFISIKHHIFRNNVCSQWQNQSNTFFKYNCQPRDYTSGGERTIDIQSEPAATLHMITIRVILPQFTIIGHNRHRMGTKINSSLSKDLKAKDQHPSQGIEPATLCSTSEIWCCTCVKRLFWSRSINQTLYFQA